MMPGPRTVGVISITVSQVLPKGRIAEALCIYIRIHPPSEPDPLITELSHRWPLNSHGCEYLDLGAGRGEARV